ncbi:MAG TPA: hypothetical protein VN704_10230 [Verrucomicrobiae bacterium]|nr:hypothetical protein [Verrucomicrobiae bacterium]
MFIFLIPYLLILDTGHRLSNEEKIYNPIEFWDRLLVSILSQPRSFL